MAGCDVYGIIMNDGIYRAHKVVMLLFLGIFIEKFIMFLLDFIGCL